MELSKGFRVALVLAAGLHVQDIWGQAPQTTDEALQQMTQAAAVIFAGQVVAVRLPQATGASGIAEIDFAVEDAVRGVPAGRYTLREWAGLWAGGTERFRAGQRYLMLLHAAGPGGLSAPVGGMDGAIPIRGGGQAAGGWVTDLGWVGTHAAAPVVYRASATLGPVGRPVPVHAETASAAENGPNSAGANIGGASPLAAVARDADRHRPYATVLTAVRSWAKESDGAR